MKTIYISGPMTVTVLHNGLGYVIEWNEFGRTCYQGGDGYIARFIYNAMPFSSKENAQKLVDNELNRW